MSEEFKIKLRQLTDEHYEIAMKSNDISCIREEIGFFQGLMIGMEIIDWDLWSYISRKQAMLYDQWRALA